MGKLKVFTTFSGIGMQERGIINSNCYDLEVIATSDIDKDAILSYASIHNNLTMDLVKNYTGYPSQEEMISELQRKHIGYDFQKKKEYNWRRFLNKTNYILEKYWLAVHLSNNLGDISLVKELPDVDLLTFSFPCTDISKTGRQQGVSYEDWKKGNSTRSGLVWEIVRLLENAKRMNNLPKYLLLENVSALISKKFIKDFEMLNELLKEIGYNVYYSEIDGKNVGIPQSRPRVFGIYIRKDVDLELFEFPKKIKNNLRLKDFLEEDVELKYFVSQMIQDRFKITDPTFIKNIIGTTQPDFRTIGQRDVVFQIDSIIGSLTATDYKQPKQILVIVTNEKKKELEEKGIFGVGNNKYVRKLTPDEGFLLMGLTKEDCINCRNMGVSDTNLYKQAGNGIITNCIKLLMEHLYKAQENPFYICEDE